MSTIGEIEAAIEKLAPPQVDELAEWLENLRILRTTPAPIEQWLDQARGVARRGLSTDALMALTRGEE